MSHAPQRLYQRQYCAPEEAKVSIFDAGLLFADAVYEVAGVYHGRLINFDGHMARLRRSLAELGIPEPMTREEILGVMRELVTRNEIDEGLVYMQVSRGTEEREFLPGDDLTPTVFMLTQVKGEDEQEAGTGSASGSSPQRTSAGRGATSRPSVCWAR